MAETFALTRIAQAGLHVCGSDKEADPKNIAGPDTLAMQQCMKSFKFGGFRKRHRFLLNCLACHVLDVFECSDGPFLPISQLNLMFATSTSTLLHLQRETLKICQCWLVLESKLTQGSQDLMPT